MSKILYHATTERKAKKYCETGHICKPVRGFDTLLGACVWAMKVGRQVIYEIEVEEAYKLPDHHNDFGNAFWSEQHCEKFKCVVSPGKA